jgi:hypothetical protein
MINPGLPFSATRVLPRATFMPTLASRLSLPPAEPINPRNCGCRPGRRMPKIEKLIRIFASRASLALVVANGVVMPNIALDEPRPLPPWLKIGVSLAVILHLAVFVCLALGADSGDWPTPFGADRAWGPQFARTINENTLPGYLQPLRMTHNYHFDTNRTSQPDVFFEVHLKDKAGQRIKTLKFPDEKANPWIRHRHQLLAHGLIQDRPVPPIQGEVIGPAGQRVEMMVWLTNDEIKRVLQVEPPPATNENELHLRKVAQHLVPRERPVMTASEWSVTLAKAYARYLCRVHHADKAEFVRHSRDAWLPAFVMVPNAPIPPNDKLACNFGEFTRD